MADELKAEHWRGVVAEQEASGLSVAAFCRERTIPAWTFHYPPSPKRLQRVPDWRKRLRGEASVPGEFAVVEVAREAVYQDRQQAPIVVTFHLEAVLRVCGQWEGSKSDDATLLSTFP
jgi:hypothetical protein